MKEVFSNTKCKKFLLFFLTTLICIYWGIWSSNKEISAQGSTGIYEETCQPASNPEHANHFTCIYTYTVSRAWFVDPSVAMCPSSSDESREADRRYCESGQLGIGRDFLDDPFITEKHFCVPCDYMSSAIPTSGPSSTVVSPGATPSATTSSGDKRYGFEVGSCDVQGQAICNSIIEYGKSLVCRQTPDRKFRCVFADGNSFNGALCYMDSECGSSGKCTRGRCVSALATEENFASLGYFKVDSLKNQIVDLSIKGGNDYLSTLEKDIPLCGAIDACAVGKVIKYQFEQNIGPGEYEIEISIRGGTSYKEKINIVPSTEKVIIAKFQDGNLGFEFVDSDYLGTSISNTGLEGCSISTGYDLACANCIARKADGSLFISLDEVLATFEKGDAIYTDNVYTALGCWDTSYEGTLTRILQIGLGISGVLLLFRIGQALTKIMSADNPEKKKEGVDMMVSALMSLLMLLFGAIGLRFLGINVLKLLPPGTINVE